MNLVPLAKSAVIEYGMLDLLVKLWNLSKNMRNRVKRLLKGRVIVLFEYDYRLIVLGCWIRTTKVTRYFQKKQQPLKGLCNYAVRNNKELKIILETNGALACNLNLSEMISPVTFEVVPKLDIGSSNFDNYLNLTFIRVIRLNIYNLNNTQIKQILSRISHLGSLEIEDSSLSDLDLSSDQIKDLRLESVTIKRNVKLPSVLESIEVKNCKGLNLLKFNKIKRFYCINPRESDSEKEYYHLFKVVLPENYKPKIRHVAINLPFSVRHAEGFDLDEKHIPKIKPRLPYLIGLGDRIDFKAAQKLNLKISSTWGLNEFKGKVTLRPRRVIVGMEEALNTKKYKELFKKATQFIINDNRKFDFSLLPDGKKHVEIDFGDIMNDPDESYNSYESPNTDFDTDVFVNKMKHLEDNLSKFDDQSVVIKCYSGATDTNRIDSESITLSDCSFDKVRFLKIICGDKIHYFRYGNQTNCDGNISSRYWR